MMAMNFDMGIIPWEKLKTMSRFVIKPNMDIDVFGRFRQISAAKTFSDRL